MHLARGKKIGVGHARYRVAVWLLIFLGILFVSSSWRAPAKDTQATGVARPYETPAPTVSALLTSGGQRAVGLAFSAAEPVAAATAAGDRIDVTAAFSSAPDGQPLARTVLKHVLVIGAARRGESIALTLALTAPEVEALAFAAANARLSLAMCPPGPDVTRSTTGVTFDDFE